MYQQIWLNPHWSRSFAWAGWFTSSSLELLPWAMRASCCRWGLPLQARSQIREDPWTESFTGGAVVSKELACQCRRHKKCGFSPWAKKTPWSRKWPPTLIFLPGKFHGQKSLVGYSPWGRKKLDMTEHLCTHLELSQAQWSAKASSIASGDQWHSYNVIGEWTFAHVSHWNLARGSEDCCHSKNWLIQTQSPGQEDRPSKLHSDGIGKGKDIPSSLLYEILIHLVIKRGFIPASCIFACNLWFKYVLQIKIKIRKSQKTQGHEGGRRRWPRALNFPWEKTVVAPTDAENKPWRKVGPQKGLSCREAGGGARRAHTVRGSHGVLEAYGGNRSLHVTHTEWSSWLPSKTWNKHWFPKFWLGPLSARQSVQQRKLLITTWSLAGG